MKYISSSLIIFSFSFLFSYPSTLYVPYSITLDDLYQLKNQYPECFEIAQPHIKNSGPAELAAIVYNEISKVTTLNFTLDEFQSFMKKEGRYEIKHLIDESVPNITWRDWGFTNSPMLTLDEYVARYGTSDVENFEANPDAMYFRMEPHNNSSRENEVLMYQNITVTLYMDPFPEENYIQIYNSHYDLTPEDGGACNPSYMYGTGNYINTVGFWGPEDGASPFINGKVMEAHEPVFLYDPNQDNHTGNYPYLDLSEYDGGMNAFSDPYQLAPLALDHNYSDMLLVGPPCDHLPLYDNSSDEGDTLFPENGWIFIHGFSQAEYDDDQNEKHEMVLSVPVNSITAVRFVDTAGDGIQNACSLTDDCGTFNLENDDYCSSCSDLVDLINDCSSGEPYQDARETKQNIYLGDTIGHPYLDVVVYSAGEIYSPHTIWEGYHSSSLSHFTPGLYGNAQPHYENSNYNFIYRMCCEISEENNSFPPQACAVIDCQGNIENPYGLINEPEILEDNLFWVEYDAITGGLLYTCSGESTYTGTDHRCNDLCSNCIPKHISSSFETCQDQASNGGNCIARDFTPSNFLDDVSIPTDITYEVMTGGDSEVWWSQSEEGQVLLYAANIAISAAIPWGSLTGPFGPIVEAGYTSDLPSLTDAILFVFGAFSDFIMGSQVPCGMDNQLNRISGDFGIEVLYAWSAGCPNGYAQSSNHGYCQPMYGCNDPEACNYNSRLLPENADSSLCIPNTCEYNVGISIDDWSDSDLHKPISSCGYANFINPTTSIAEQLIVINDIKQDLLANESNCYCLGTCDCSLEVGGMSYMDYCGECIDYDTFNPSTSSNEISTCRIPFKDYTQNSYDTILNNSNFSSIFTVDIDNDSDLDILFGGLDGVSLFTSAGSISYDLETIFSEMPMIPLFTHNQTNNSGTNIKSIFSADMDGDYHMDVLAGGDSGIYLWKNLGQYPVSSSISNIAWDPISNRIVKSIIALDLDGDIDIDIIAGGDFGIVWYENNGDINPTFSEHTITNTGATSLSGEDVNGDGASRLDLLAIGNNGEVRLYQNDGSTTPDFSEQLICSNCALSSIVPADLDSDGDIDVLTNTERGWRWHENNGLINPTFSTSSEYNYELYPCTTHNTFVSVTDIDMDDDLDVVYGHGWYRNESQANQFSYLGSGNSWDGTYSSDCSSNIYLQHVADIDNDGDDDVLNFTSSNSGYFENRIGHICPEGWDDCGVCGGDGLSCVSVIQGDVNLDYTVNIMDIIMLVDYMFFLIELSTEQFLNGDINLDNTINISDVIMVVDIIIGNLDRNNNLVENINVYKNNNGLYIEESGFVAFDVTISHDEDFNFTLTEESFFASSKTDDKITRIIIADPKSTMLFETNGEFEIDEIIAVTSGGAIVNVNMDVIPSEFSLAAPYPNPFNPSTTIDFTLPLQVDVSLIIYDLRGAVVEEILVNKNMKPGFHSVKWHAGNYASGPYFVRMIAGDYHKTQKMMVVK